MDTTLTFTPQTVATLPRIAEHPRPADHTVPAVTGTDTAPTLPADKAFVAQVVTARLAGTEFPENPGEIAPPERTLRPYDVPMLPYQAEEAV